MLESIFGPKTVRLLEKEKDILAKDLEVIRKILAYLDKNKDICLSILNFAVKGEDVQNLFSSMLAVEHLLAELAKKEARLEIKAIEILETKLEGIEDEEIRSEISSLLSMLKEEKQALEEILALDAKLREKKYKISPAQVAKIREAVSKQMSLLKTHESIISRLIGKTSEAEAKIKDLLGKTYGRAVSKERADRMQDLLILSDEPDLVPCFILTAKISSLLGSIESRRKEITAIFRAVGAIRIQKLVIFEIDKSQDLALLEKCPPSQPQKVEGLIEQKLPGSTRIKIIDVYSL